jgi:hypothetical protein
MTKFAEQEEIQYAHSVLLNGKPHFEDDKIEIIECNESLYIKACPGSGKTTTLLAKLIILANRMPLPNNQGICVLTHTNVAIDEIKSKLGHKADILFKYPNHFGTIQSFVDKFLAIPFFTSQFKKKPTQISNDFYTKNLDRSLKMKLNSIKKTNEALNKRMWYFFLSNDGLLNNIRLVIINSEFELFNITNQSIVHFNKPRKGKSYSDWNASEKEEMKNLTIAIIMNVYNYYSSISFHDAYTFSNAYTLKVPDIQGAISSRFKYLFIDEMQDTDIHQIDIIDKVFDASKTIVQRFGDHRQAIYNKVSHNELWEQRNPLPIDGSKRFGESIAKVLRYVCIEKNEELKANQAITSLPPVMIVFDNPENVLPKFCELLKSREIDGKTIWNTAQDSKKSGNTSYKIKAIGWVGQDKPNELTIKSYFGNFNAFAKKKDKVDYDSLKSFLKKQERAKVTDYSNKIVDALLHILLIANVKYSNGKTNRNYTKTTLLEDFENKSPDKFLLFKTNIAKWAKGIHNSEAFCSETKDEIKSFIQTEFFQIFGIDSANQYIDDFLKKDSMTTITDEEIKNKNLYKQDDIEVDIATIHSVKGETHVATLYLETFYQGEYESSRIKEQLKGNYYIPPKGKDIYKKETLKMAHVGMSRPQFFLCMAVHRKRFDVSFDVNNGGMWEIVNA